jgi:uncharacterized protein (TIGR00369 family)
MTFNMDAAASPNIDELVAKGWEPFENKGFIGLIGPVLFKTHDKRTRCGFLASDKHENRNGVIHGGMLAAFADRSLGTAARQGRSDIRTATIELSMHYVSSVNIGEFVEADCEIVRMTRTLAFMRATLTVGTRIVATAEGVWKILTPKEAT